MMCEQESAIGAGSVEVCEELAFHGVDYILSVSVAEGQVLLVDVEKVRPKERSENIRKTCKDKVCRSRAAGTLQCIDRRCDGAQDC